MGNFNQIITKLNEDFQDTMSKDTGQAYSKLSTIFEELGKFMREYIQDETGDGIKAIIKKLRKGKALSDEDKGLTRLWVVGDAEYYTKLENNCGDWKKELERLVGEINKLKTDNPDIETVSRLRGLFRDASRVLADLFYFAQQKERIEKFEASTQDIDPAEGKILADILEQKYKSPDF